MMVQTATNYRTSHAFKCFTNYAPRFHCSMARCKLCVNDRALIRAHIIPDAFNRDLRGGAVGAPVMIANDPNQHPRRRPGGHYDENLVCDECERRFGPWDEYAADFFLNRFLTEGQPLVAPNGETLAYQYANVDYDQLKLFAISLLWRAAATSVKFFEKVTVGPHEERARRMVLQAMPGLQDDFSVFIVRWVARPNHEGVTKAQFSPYCARLNGVNEVKLFLAGAIIHIKVDKRPYSAPLPDLILKPSGPLYVIAREFEGSQDLAALRPALEAIAARRQGDAERR